MSDASLSNHIPLVVIKESEIHLSKVKTGGIITAVVSTGQLYEYLPISNNCNQNFGGKFKLPRYICYKMVALTWTKRDAKATRLASTLTVSTPVYSEAVS